MHLFFENMAEMTKFPYKNFLERGELAISAIFSIFWGNPKNAQSSAAFGFFWDLIEDSWFLGTFGEKNFWHPKMSSERGKMAISAIFSKKWSNVRVFKKIEKSRFCKSYDTLTTIQLGEKTQLTKVVSPLKRFGRHLSSRGDNCIFGEKISLIRSSFSCVFGGGGSTKPK